MTASFHQWAIGVAKMAFGEQSMEVTIHPYWYIALPLCDEAV